MAKKSETEAPVVEETPVIDLAPETPDPAPVIEAPPVTDPAPDAGAPDEDDDAPVTDPYANRRKLTRAQVEASYKVQRPIAVTDPQTGELKGQWRMPDVVTGEKLAAAGVRQGDLQFWLDNGAVTPKG